MAGRDMYFWMGGAVAALAAERAGSLPLGMAAAAGIGDDGQVWEGTQYVERGTRRVVSVRDLLGEVTHG